MGMRIDDCKVQIHSDGSMVTVYRVATGYEGRGYTNLDEVPIHLRESLYAVPSNDLRDAFFCSQHAALQMIDWLSRQQEEQRRLVLVRSRSSSLAAVGASVDNNSLALMTEERFASELDAATRAFEKRKADEARAEAFRKEQEAKEEAERIAKAAKEEAERIERNRLNEIARQQAEAKRIAELAPDREKIDAYINALGDIIVPFLTSPEADAELNQLGVDFIERLRDLMVRLEKGTP